jgi:outer membrane receptor protein involved in Fe transport
VNRYITGRGVEWANQKTLVVSLSESVIYSGENRPMDIAYLNPLSTHLEIELNNRQNRMGTSSGNGVWQASIDWLAKPNLRISGNFLFDEFVLDKIETDAGKEHGSAQSFKVVFTPSHLSSGLLSFFFAWIRVGSPTLRHGDGNNNFVQRGQPLGWEYGSDGREIKLGLNYFNMRNLIGNLEIGQREIGEESIILRPYETYSDYLSGQFPSGIVNKTSFISGQVQWWWKPNVSLITGLEWSDSRIDGKTIDVHIGVDIYYPKSFKL